MTMVSVVCASPKQAATGSIMTPDLVPPRNQALVMHTESDEDSNFSSRRASNPLVSPSISCETVLNLCLLGN